MMKLAPQSNDPSDYLHECDIIDYQHPEVSECAAELSANYTPSDHLAIAKRCFEFVRDEIKHTADFAIDIITCKASEVLHHQTGFCYAKSHLLAALLRANNIPAGLCYQRLAITADEDYGSTSGEPFCSHGLNAVYLPKIGWYRVDPRGNKKGVNAQFMPPTEQLAFQINEPDEKDFETIYVKPIKEVIDSLVSANSLAQISKHLPDKITTSF